MDITGSIRSVLPEQTGSGKNGIWKKQNIIIQTEGQYPKDVCITVWGDKIDKDLLKVGISVRIHFDLESREFNGKWYTDVKAWKVETGAGKSDSVTIFPDDFESRDHLLLAEDLPF